MESKNQYRAKCLTDIYITLMLLVFPLFVGFEGYSEITGSKFVFFFILTAAWLLCIVILTILDKERPALSIAQKLAVRFAVWACISWLASPDKTESFFGASRYDGLVTQLLYVGIFLGVSRYGRWRAHYAHLLSAAVVVCGIVAVGQMLGLSLLFPGKYTYYDSGIKYVSKFLGTIGNTNLLAAFLCLGIPAATAAAAFGYIQRPLLCLAASLGGMMLSFTESAGGMLALIIAAAVCAPVLALNGLLPQGMRYASFVCLGLFIGAAFAGGTILEYLAPCALVMCAAGVFIFENKIPKDKHFTAVVLVLVIFLFVGLLTVYFWPGTEGAIYELSQLMHGNASDEFGSSRILIWRETLALVPEHLMLGGGPDTLALRLDLEFTRYFPELGQTLSTYADNAHNVYLGYLVNLGLPGLLIYLALIGVTIKKIFLCRDERLIPACALICALAENFFGLGLCLVSPIMWVLWGLIFTEEKENPEVH